MIDLKNKKFLLTGGTSGIGKEILKYLSLKNKVILLTRKKIKHPNTYSYICNLENSNQIDENFIHIKKKFKSLDGIINCAGFSEKNSSLQNVESIKKIIDVNLLSTYKICILFSKMMKNNSSIVNISSINAYQAFKNNPGYMVSKNIILNLSKSLALDLSKKKIRVNTISPGYIKTRMTNKSYNNKKRYKLIKSRTILNRWGEPGEIAKPVIFLLSSGSSYINGSDLIVDGGWISKGI